MQYLCNVCGYVYDEIDGEPEDGIEPDTTWEEVPEDYQCPYCKVGKEMFMSAG